MWWTTTAADIQVPETRPVSPTRTVSAIGDHSCTADSSGSDSFLVPTQPNPREAKSTSPMASYFFDPQSPHVSTITSAVPSSPMSSPSLGAADQVPWNHRASAPLVPPSSSRQDFEADLHGLDDSCDETALIQQCGGSPVRSSVRRSTLAVPRRIKTMTEALGAKENVPPGPLSSSSTSLSTHSIPGFGSHEMDHKILPCFPVKCDGLMRVTPQTVSELMQGHYDDRISGFQIVDCRFAYEHEGGHIAGAVNLNTIEQIHRHFLTPGQGLHAGRILPTRTQSGQPDEHGDLRKFVLIFHCEFSYKRSPSMALALRQADRSLFNDYPRCYFPDVYILQGGYADFFQYRPDLCEPRAYIGMDDPRYLQARSSELSGFRRQFSRNRSFAYGDAPTFGRTTSASATAMAQMRRAPTLVPTNFVPLMPASTNAHKQDAPAGRTKRSGSATTASQPAAFTVTKSATTATAASSLAPPMHESVARDTSYSSGDSSFEAGASDSPCAVAGWSRPVLGEVPHSRSSLANRLLKRADTINTISTLPM